MSSLRMWQSLRGNVTMGSEPRSARPSLGAAPQPPCWAPGLIQLSEHAADSPAQHSGVRARPAPASLRGMASMGTGEGRQCQRKPWELEKDAR